MPGNGAAASYGDLLITSLVVLAGVCIAAYIVVKVVGRFLATGRMRGAHLLDIVARLPLEPRRSLYVVEVAGKTLLVGTSEMGLSVLSELDGEEVKARAVPRQSFGELVRSAWMKRRSASSAHVGADVSDAQHATKSASPTSVAATTAKAGVSAETRGAHVAAKSDEARTDDVSAETRRAYMGAKSDEARTDDVSAETRGVHVGATSDEARTDDDSAETRSAHVGASGDGSGREGQSDDSAETRDAHVGAKSDREES